MVSLTTLWLPILLSAVLVFIASSIIHMVFRYHNSEYRMLPNEERLLEALRAEKVAPGFYSFPHALSPKEMSSPEMQQKFTKGPVGTLHVIPNGLPAMGQSLVQWFGYCLLVGFCSAYLASRTLVDADTHYLQVFRVVGTVSFMAYAFAHISDGVWKQKPWTMTFKHVFDGLVYGLLTAGIFGWLWP